MLQIYIKFPIRRVPGREGRADRFGFQNWVVHLLHAKNFDYSTDLSLQPGLQGPVREGLSARDSVEADELRHGPEGSPNSRLPAQ